MDVIRERQPFTRHNDGNMQNHMGFQLFRIRSIKTDFGK